MNCRSLGFIVCESTLSSIIPCGAIWLQAGREKHAGREEHAGREKHKRRRVTIRARHLRGVIGQTVADTI
jgi:hypothetical protein